MGVFKKRGTWWIDYYVEGVRVRQNTHAASRRVAEDMLAKARVEGVEGRLSLQRVKPSPLFVEFAKTYLDYSKQNKKESSYKRDRLSVNNLSTLFGKRSLRDVRPMLIEQYKKKRLEAGKAPATVNREVACLKNMFSVAILWGGAFENPVKRVKMLRENNEVTNPLTDEDERLLLENAAPHLKDIIVCALDTGLRRGEIFNLRWPAVDLTRGLLHVVESKTDKKRSVPISERLRPVLMRLKRGAVGEYVFASPRTGDKTTKIDTAFWRALERAGIRHKGYRFHDLRHSFATRLIEAGTNHVTVMQLMGHKSLRMLERYAHPGEQHRRDAIHTLDGRRAQKTGVDFEKRTG